MSYTTRCPACATTFKVVPDQLKMSDGWVRCGHCADVFDATLYLQAWTPPTPAAAPEDPPPEQPPREPGPVPTPAVSARPPDPVVAEVTASPVAQACDTPAPEAPTEPAPAKPKTTEAIGADFQAELERFAATSSGATVLPHTPPAQVAAPAPTTPAEPPPDTALTSDEPGFVRQAKRQAFWRSPGVRAVLGVIGVLLATLLATQWALHERDRLTASQPQLAPLLARLCEPLGCEIGPLRRIDAVVIDSSALVRRLGNFYAFDLVLKNTATLPVAMPALELSLTDSSDRVLARRVFLPSELPSTPTLLPAQGSLSLSLRLSITEADGVSMAGYRALVFYP